ncbi:MAG: M10 family metallopeptidase C-terminal domain-containing protein [Shimia sp.]|uniref:M10 family metallopeptidase C-terminal domain-containing protein n=1 Tax=Shimia sp. TaxID=1954381 RepID=UPI0025FF8D61|nr:M10 family metallopeptidase C-terminal domain-containing protein [Shimia sp.]MCH2066925.1 M10 family metallopeptidase C-terminal domain-containing protein [Shimia sp.]
MLIQNALIPTMDEPIFHEGHDDGHDDGPKETPIVGDPNGALVLEDAGDAPANISTPYTMSVGDTFRGTIDTTDVDFVAITLNEGDFYQVSVTGDDPRIWVLDASGNTIEFNDDIDFNGGNYNSFLTFEATYTGTYYFAVNGFNAVASNYDLSVNTFTPIADGSIQDMADFLTTGYWTGNGSTARSFDTSVSNMITVNINGLSAEGQILARWAFEAWEMVADIVFQEVLTVADINFQDTDAGAWSSSTVSSGEILSSTVNVSTDWLSTYGTSLNSYSFQTYIHEIGHALGLGHQGGYNGSAEYGIDEDFGNDSWQMSIMSYFDQADSLGTNASYANIISAMMVDIVAIQDLYGAAGPSGGTYGNTVWGPGSNLIGYLGDFFNGVITSNGPVAMTIFDSNGTDLMDLKFYSQNARINMNGGEFSDVGGLIGNLGIALGTVIENVNTGAGNDRITGNGVGNVINTNGGNDWVNAGNGADLARGGAGNDVLIGGNHNDSLFGGSGLDTLIGGNGNDSLDGNSGSDTLFGGAGNDKLFGGGGSDNVFGGGGRDTLNGGDGDDLVNGNTGSDTVFGGDGNDKLFGGGSDDTLYGGSGNDTMSGDDGNDVVYGNAGSDRLNGGTGDDNLLGGDNGDTLSGGSGNDTLSGGNDADLLNGNTGSDTLLGGSGNDTLLGGGGDDVLDFGAGNDIGDGGLGADIFVFSTGVGASNTVNNFSSTESDILQLDDLLWAPSGNGPVLTETDVINNFGADVGLDFVLTFGSDIIRITGWAGQFDASMIDIV